MNDALAAELAEYEYQIEQISGALEATPDNDELLTLKKELQDLIDITKARVSTTGEPEQNNVKGTPTEYERKRKHEIHETRKVGEQVLAKWIGGDHQFYPARITSITGNQADPIYTVKFLEYNEIQTLHGHQMRNLNEQKKRTLDSGTNARANSAKPVPPPPAGSSGVDISDAAQEDLKPAAKKKKGPSLKDNLAQSANSWNAFAKSGPKTKRIGKRTPIGESSMFRTEEGGRVGVIGSGKSMTADPGKRGRHVFRSDG